MLRRRFLLTALGSLALVPAISRRSAAGSTTEGGPIVKTRSGDLRGSTAGGVHAFKGIPFAAPPFGANRLLPPQPVETWNGVRDALEFGPKPPQAAYPPGIGEYLAELVGPGEDCLTLNLWTPALGEEGQPVMVYIPGGMFEFHATGASAYYDGSRFARDRLRRIGRSGLAALRS